MTLKENHWRVLAVEDPVWIWFMKNGPHGSSFKWHQELPRYNALNHLREIVAEHQEIDNTFIEKARKAAISALGADDIELIRRGIQVLCVVGTDEDVRSLRSFLEHENPNVVIDTKCCIFERRLK